MKPSDIRDENSLRVWLKSRPEATRPSDTVVIAQRGALRVFPLWSGAMGGAWARIADLTALPILRVTLTLGVARIYPTPEVKAADAASAAAATFAADAATFADAATIAARVARVAFAAADAAAAFWASIRADAAALETGTDSAALPLWPDAVPDWFATRDTRARALWAEQPEVWLFWARWWDGVLSGHTLDAELQKQVALIPDAVWQQGPAAVAEAIRLIEDRLDLLQQVSTMKAELAGLQAALARQASAAHRAHNHPPDLIDAPAPIVVQVNTLVAALNEAEAELAKPAPEPGALRRIGALIVDATLTALRYCGGLADTMLQKAAEEIGSTGAKVAIGIGGLSIVSHLEPLKDLGKALIAFAARLLGV
ncbi:hypothetical protein LHP98_00225 [Rhodobacter sp. Har01]|uniref:hypothetical protein n=1 Tax=Rhodobacter sp. Har01 TaxID=2883999 RepID=UPI001D06F021|nr:hypothetical protein [Rhodobacter sp. Har01]MCB6176554.1 hypothetical protein [Rhodobacter sp. Har01]